MGVQGTPKTFPATPPRGSLKLLWKLNFKASRLCWAVNCPSTELMEFAATTTAVCTPVMGMTVGVIIVLIEQFFSKCWAVDVQVDICRGLFLLIWRVRFKERGGGHTFTDIEC